MSSTPSRSIAISRAICRRASAQRCSREPGRAGSGLQQRCAPTGPPLRIIGNLPYNISTPLLFHLLAQRAAIRDMHFMLQKEVVDRMVAAPGSQTYGRLTVMLAPWVHIGGCSTSGAGAFRAAAQGELGGRAHHAAAGAAHFDIGSAATLRTRRAGRFSLSGARHCATRSRDWCAQGCCEQLGIDPGARAEQARAAAVRADAGVRCGSESAPAGPAIIGRVSRFRRPSCPDISKILLVVDLTEDSELVGERAKAIAACYGSRIQMLHVVEYVPVEPMGETLLPAVQIEEELIERARVSACKELARRLGLARQRLLRRGG